MTTIRTQFDTPQKKEKLAKAAIIAIGAVATLITLDVAGVIGSYLGSISTLFSVSFLFVLLSAIQTQSSASKFSINTLAATNRVSAIRDRIVTKPLETADSEQTEISKKVA